MNVLTHYIMSNSIFRLRQHRTTTTKMHTRCTHFFLYLLGICMWYLAIKLWTVLWWSFLPSRPSLAIFLTANPTDNNFSNFFLSILNLNPMATWATLDVSLSLIFFFDKTNAACHCVKIVRIWSYSDSHFSAFGLNTRRYGVSLRI